jgi:3-methylcrotonyl-CoA carboxylase alpha subunit
MRTHWLDGGRVREALVTPLGGSRFRVVVDGAALELEVEALGGGAYRLLRDGSATPARVTAAGSRRFVRIGTLDFVLERAAGSASGRSRAHAAGGLESPLPGLVTRVMVQVGESVKKGQPLVAVEAMKMEHVLRSPRDGQVRTLRAAPGEMVSPGVALVELEE